MPVRPELFTIRRTGSGTLSTMARPRGGDWLEDEITALAAAGVSVLVSLLSDAEVSELRLDAEAEAARAAGMTFYHLPTPDRQVPDQVATLALTRALGAHLGHGDSVAIHCRNGIGRASTIAAVVLVEEGVPPQHAWTMISAARGLNVPDTAGQRESITRLGSPGELT